MTSLAKTLLDFAEVMEQIEENDGVISDELLPALAETELAVAQKIDAYVGFYDAVRAQIERTKKTVERFKKTQNTLENLEQRLKDNVKHLMQTHDILSLQGEERSIKLQNAGGVQATEKPADMFYSIDCVNEKYLLELDGLVEEKKVYVISDKEKFKQAVKDNKIHSCFLLPRGKYVKFV